MKLKTCLIAIATSLPLLVSAAELSIAKQISPMAINGVELEERMIELPQGTHQLVGRYSYPLPKDGSKKRYQSQPMVFTFSIKQDDQIVLKAPRFTRFDRAEYAFNNEVADWQLTDDSGNAIEFSVDELPTPDGLFPFKDIEKVVADYNSKQNIIVTSSGVVTVSAAQAALMDSATKSTSGTAMSTNNVQQLQAWYLKANKEERKTFRKWMIDQD